MTTTSLLWPTKEEYDLAISRWQQTVQDPALRNATLCRDEIGICPFGGANLYVCIYKIGDWMVRCFCSNAPYQPPSDIVMRYKAIADFCNASAFQVSALLPISFLLHGIQIGQRILPLVKMPFLTGAFSLGEFIAENYQNQFVMQQLSEAWLRLIGEMEGVPLAHGDLDLTNVMIERTASSFSLKLIDYDNMWFPQLVACGQTEFGHEAFQHPAFFYSRTRPYDATMDRFSALVIYISLKMLSYRPELYIEWGADDSEQLLLSSADYLNANLATSRIAQLRALCHPELYPFIDELVACLRQGRMPLSITQIHVQRQQAGVYGTYSLPSIGTTGLTGTAGRPQVMQGPAVALWEQRVKASTPIAYPMPPDLSSPLPGTKITPLVLPPLSPTETPSQVMVSEKMQKERRGVSLLVLVLFIVVIILMALIITILFLLLTHVIIFASFPYLMAFCSSSFLPRAFELIQHSHAISHLEVMLCFS